MKRPAVESIIVLVAAVGLVALFTEPQWRPALHAKLAPTVPVRPLAFSEAMQCPAWRPGLSRTLVVMATEDEEGRVIAQQCMRTKERGKFRVM